MFFLHLRNLHVQAALEQKDVEIEGLRNRAQHLELALRCEICVGIYMHIFQLEVCACVCIELRKFVCIRAYHVCAYPCIYVRIYIYVYAKHIEMHGHQNFMCIIICVSLSIHIRVPMKCVHSLVKYCRKRTQARDYEGF